MAGTARQTRALAIAQPVPAPQERREAAAVVERAASPPPAFGIPLDHLPARGAGRWTADAWLLLRQGGDTATRSGAVPPTYGASQAGAVLRYRLKSPAPAAPTLYLRATTALDDRAAREAAAGIAARPLRRIPLVAMAEVRLHAFGGETELRPAVMLVSEFPPLDLGRAVRAESYLQAGYVDGRFATGFADGQVRLTREVRRFERGGVSAGAGAWGGVQRDAGRIDVGPTATVDLRLGPAAARLAFDYRFRAAGDAAPDSGPAVTLSTGF
ncbi:hypothetical protein J4558_11180 [Leptolyngbya sp. 15MV]|nr:hypothetical protein J4558_11180 [Leptolyngbya sp. 15MV]